MKMTKFEDTINTLLFEMARTKQGREEGSTVESCHEKFEYIKRLVNGTGKDITISINGWIGTGGQGAYYTGHTILHMLMATEPVSQTLQQAQNIMASCFENKIKNNCVENRIIYEKCPVRNESLITPLHVAGAWGNWEMINHYNNLQIKFNKEEVEIDKKMVMVDQKELITDFLIENIDNPSMSDDLRRILSGDAIKNTNKLTKDVVNQTDVNDQTALQFSLRPLLAYCLSFTQKLYQETFHEKFIDHEKSADTHTYDTYLYNFAYDLKMMHMDRLSEVGEQEVITTKEMQLLRKLQKDEELHAKLAERYYLTAKTLLDLKSDINLLEDHYKPVAKFIALKDELKNSYIRQLLETKIWFEEAQDETKKHEIPYPPLDMKPWELMINYYYIWFDEIG